jgi:O-antigen ligase
LLWRVALLMFLDYPVLGIGRSAFYDHYEEYAPRVDPWLVPRPHGPHNIPVHILAETGILGLAAYVAAVAAAVLGVRRAKRAFREAGLDRLGMLAEATEIAIYGFLVSAMFVNDNMYQRPLWLLAAVGIVARQLASRLAQKAPAVPAVASDSAVPETTASVERLAGPPA